MSKDKYRNPFLVYRTEQMGEELWKFYVNEPTKNFIGGTPFVFEGTRGTGKTMFLLCNSWQEKYKEAEYKGQKFNDFLKETNHLGFYYKVDSRFVKCFDEDSWTGIFNTYLNVILSKEILDLIFCLRKENIITQDLIKSICKSVCSRLDVSIVESLEELKAVFDDLIISIEHYVNDTEKKKPIGLVSNTLVENIITHLKTIEILSKTTFHIFIDEYEEFTFNQQVIVNTLLKLSNKNLVFDFGVKKGGFHTYQTTSGSSEIRQKDDFRYFSPDHSEFYDDKRYEDLLNGICRKRIKEEFDSIGVDYQEEHLNIDYYLKDYGKYYEEENGLKNFANSSALIDIKDRIKNEILKQAKRFKYDQEQIDSYYDELTDCKPMKLRMHLALLMRSGRYFVKVSELVEEKRKNSSRYKDWYHNMEDSLCFLLCNELGIEKAYHGFTVYTALTSGIVRSFLELVDWAFDFAYNSKESFSFEKPRPFTVEEQTGAVYFVSKLKISEITSYEPHGLLLMNFVLSIGEIFKLLHSDSNSTLGENGFNHFYAKTNDLRTNNEKAFQLLRHSVMHGILEETNSTKVKTDEQIEFKDYILNHIYCPYFKILHVKKRKLPIKTNDLAILFCGSHNELKDVINKYSKIKEDNIPTLFSNYDLSE